MQRQHDEQRALLELWDIFLRHRGRFILPCFLVSTLVLCTAFILPRKYGATAIFERRTDIVLTEMTNRGATRTFSAPRQSLVEELAGQPAIDELLRELGPTLREKGWVRNEAERIAFRDHLWRNIVVTWDISTAELDRARVAYVGSSPELAEIVVNGLVENYIERARFEMEQRLRESAAFFRAEVAEQQRVIEQIENRLLEFEIANGELLPDTPNNVQDQLASIQDSLIEVTSLRDAAALRVQTLQQSLQQTPEQVPTIVHGRNPELDRLDAQRRELMKQLRQYTTEFMMTDAHPDVINTRAQIAAIEKAMAQTDAEIVTERQLTANPKRAELELQLAEAMGLQRAYSEQMAALRQQIAELSQSTAEMFEVRSEHRKLNRNLAEAQRQLNFWEDNLRRIEMALTAENGNRGVRLEFLQPATASSRPVSPNLAQVFMAAALLGMVAGTIGVFLAHRSDQTFSEGEDLAEATGLPLFGSVSELITAQHRRFRRLRKAVLYPVNAVAMAAVVLGIGLALYVELENPHGLALVKTKVASLLSVGRPQSASAQTMPDFDAIEHPAPQDAPTE